MTEWIREQFNASFPVDMNEDGFAGPTAVPDNMNRILSVAGYAMNPTPIPLMDNAKFCASQGVASSMRPEDEPYFDELMRLMFEVATPTDLRLTKEATSACPYYTTDIAYRKERALAALRNPDVFLDLATGGPKTAVDLLEKFHALFFYTIYTRLQSDAVEEDESGKFIPKRRTAPTDEQARSGDFEGGIPADKSVRDSQGNLIEGHFAMRARDVFGLNGVINYFLTGVMGCFRSVYLSRFAKTFKARGDDDKTATISSWGFATGVDVKTMDKLIPKFFFEKFTGGLTKYVDERVAKLIRRACAASFIASAPWEDTPGTYNPVHGPDPMKEVADLCVGLPSGVAVNKECGTLWMTFVYIICLKDLGFITSPSQVEPLLQHKNRLVAMQVTSDDAVFLSNSKTHAAKLANLQSPYAVLEKEHPVKYLGSVYHRDVTSALSSSPNIITYILNMLCREDSVEWKKPQDWATGVLARARVYSAAPVFRDVNALLDEAFRRFLGHNPLHLAPTMCSWNDMTYTDALVRMNPGVLHYKVDPADVSPEVLDDVVATIPHDEFMGHIRHLFKAPIVH